MKEETLDIFEESLISGGFNLKSRKSEKSNIDGYVFKAYKGTSLLVRLTCIVPDISKNEGLWEVSIFASLGRISARGQTSILRNLQNVPGKDEFTKLIEIAWDYFIEELLTSIKEKEDDRIQQRQNWI